MKNDPVTTLLLVLLTLCVLATAVTSFAFVTDVRTLHVLQYESAVISRKRAIGQALANDAVEYSKRNPAILPILQSVGIRLGTAETNKLPNR